MDFAVDTKTIGSSFTKTIPSVFPGFIFAFIVGSIASQSFKPTSDIDIFVCLNQRPEPSQKALFLKWYFKIHEQVKLKPDLRYPGEIMPWEQLSKKLTLIKNTPPHKQFTNSSIYDGIIWAGMLSGDQLFFIGDKHKFASKKLQAQKILNKWGQKLF